MITYLNVTHTRYIITIVYILRFFENNFQTVFYNNLKILFNPRLEDLASESR